MWFTVALQRGCMLYCYAHCYTICSSEHPSCCSTFLSSLCRAVCSSVLCHYSVYLSAWHKTLSATDCRAPGTAAILRYIRCCICLCLAQKYRASEMYLSEEVISHSVRCPPREKGDHQAQWCSLSGCAGEGVGVWWGDSGSFRGDISCFWRQHSSSSYTKRF